MDQFMYFAGVLIVAALVVLAVVWVTKRGAAWIKRRASLRSDARCMLEKQREESRGRLDRIERRLGYAQGGVVFYSYSGEPFRAESEPRTIESRLAALEQKSVTVTRGGSVPARRTRKAGARR